MATHRSKKRATIILLGILVTGAVFATAYLLSSKNQPIPSVETSSAEAAATPAEAVSPSAEALRAFSEAEPSPHLSVKRSKPSTRSIRKRSAAAPYKDEQESAPQRIAQNMPRPAPPLETPIQETSVFETPTMATPVPESPATQTPNPEAPVEVKTKTPRDYSLDPEFWVWAGIGANYQAYQQNIPSLAGSAKFQNIQGPTLSLEAGAQSANFGADISYKQTPGSMTAPKGSTITNGNFLWKTTTTEMLYRPDESLLRYRFGLQYQKMPFMVYTISNALLDIRSNTLVMAMVGLDRTMRLSEKLRAEWQIRYQHPVASGTDAGDSFSVTPVMALDGTVGASYAVTPSFRLGIQWYGQYHNYRFDYKGPSEFKGEQTLFYTNAELRAGFEF